MFRPPPTVLETGTEEDMEQFQEIMDKRSTPVTPSFKQKGILDSPDFKPRPRQNVSTPTGSISSPD